MIEVTDLETNFSTGFIHRRVVRAVDGVSFWIEEGETLGLVGESGCGKTTLGRSILRLIEPDRGRIVVDGTDVTALSRSELRRFRPRMQMIFQDAYASLNPRMRVSESVAEPLKIHRMGSRADIDRRVRELIDEVGLNEEHLNRRPYELSGGQNQRVALARVLALKPKFLVADEPTSALDVSVQAQILNLIRDLGRDYRMTCLYISHDLGITRAMSSRVAVMLEGRIVESAGPPTSSIVPATLHPKLVDAAFAGRACTPGKAAPPRRRRWSSAVGPLGGRDGVMHDRRVTAPFVRRTRRQRRPQLQGRDDRPGRASRTGRAGCLPGTRGRCAGCRCPGPDGHRSRGDRSFGLVDGVNPRSGKRPGAGGLCLDPVGDLAFIDHRKRQSLPGYAVTILRKGCLEEDKTLRYRLHDTADAEIVDRQRHQNLAADRDRRTVDLTGNSGIACPGGHDAE